MSTRTGDEVKFLDVKHAHVVHENVQLPKCFRARDGGDRALGRAHVCGQLQYFRTRVLGLAHNTGTVVVDTHTADMK